MGKFNKKPKGKKPAALEIVPKESEEAAPLPETRNSDDVPLKKVKTRLYSKRTLFINFLK